MPKYVTEQRLRLISFLEEHPDGQFSAKEIARCLHSDKISSSAIYRNLSTLEEEGRITSILKDGVREKFYRSLTSQKCQSCIHLVCTKCGKTFHLSDSETRNLMDSTLENNGFAISAIKSVLYGVCKKCDL